MRRFSGSRVVVTGAASGIGRAVSARFEREGATVFGLDFDPSATDGAGPRAARISNADVRDRAAMATLFDEIAAEAGGIDVLVTCAGVYRPADALTVGDEDFEFLFGVNVHGTFIAAQEAARIMSRAAVGRIVTVSSVAAQLSTPENTLYSASKGAVDSLTRGLAVALAPHGIRVNGVRPGPVETPQGLEAMRDPAYRERMLGRQLIDALAKPDDIAAAIAFLASDDARFITGQLTNVDGGIQAVR